MMDEDLLKAIFHMGPTASGKTGAGVYLQSQLPVEIISVDSALVSRVCKLDLPYPPMHWWVR